MAANLENTIHEKVKSLPPEKQQRVLSMVEEMLSEKEATQGDHYLYGSPKRDNSNIRGVASNSSINLSRKG